VRFSCGLAKYGQVRGVDGQGNGAVAHVATTSIMDKGFDNISSCVTTSVPSSASILDVPLSRDALGMWTVVSSNPGSSIDGGEVSLTLPSESAVATLSPPQLAEPPSINRPFSALIAQSRGIYRGRQLGRALPHALARINDVGQLQVHLYDKPASCSDEDWPRMATAFTLPPGPGGTYFGGGRTLAPCVIDDAVVRASELVLAGSPRECQVSIAPFRAARAEHVHGTLELDQPSSFNGVTIAHGTIGSGTFDAEICKDERPNPVTYPSEAQPGPVRGMITGDTLTIKSALASVDTAGGLTKLTLYLRAGVTCNNRGESDLAWVGIDPRAGGASHFVGAPQPITGVTATDTSVDSSLGNAWMVVQRLDDARATGSLFVDIPSERTRFAGQFDASVCH
jgi:hypothetical protein